MIFNGTFQKKSKVLDGDLERRNGVSCCGETWVRKLRWVHITNSSVISSPSRVQCRKRINWSQYWLKDQHFRLRRWSKKSNLKKYESEHWILSIITAFGLLGLSRSQCNDFESKCWPEPKCFRLKLWSKKNSQQGEMWVGISEKMSK